MKRTILHRTLLIIGVVFLVNALSYGQSKSRPDESPQTEPIQLSQIRFAFAVQNGAGQLVWQDPKPGAPNRIPAGAQRLRFTAKVVNRPTGASIRIRAVLQELCPSPDPGKPFLSRLRHLTESDSTGQQTPTDATDDEIKVIGPGGVITVELLVHCDDCGRAICGKQCPGRDHLGEGPHVVTLTTSDSTEPSRMDAPPAKPSSFRVNIRSVCHKSKPAARHPATNQAKAGER